MRPASLSPEWAHEHVHPDISPAQPHPVMERLFQYLLRFPERCTWQNVLDSDGKPLGADLGFGRLELDIPEYGRVMYFLLSSSRFQRPMTFALYRILNADAPPMLLYRYLFLDEAEEGHVPEHLTTCLDAALLPAELYLELQSRPQQHAVVAEHERLQLHSRPD